MIVFSMASHSTAILALQIHLQLISLHLPDAFCSFPIGIIGAWPECGPLR